MKVLFFLESFQLGGVEKALIDFVNSLDMKNNKVTICVWGNDNAMLHGNPLNSAVEIIKSPNIKRLIKTKNVRINKLLKYINVLLLHLFLLNKQFDRVVNFHYAANWRCSLLKFNCQEQIVVYHDQNVYGECFSEKLNKNISKYLFVSDLVKKAVEEKYPYIKAKSNHFYNEVNLENVKNKADLFIINKEKFAIVTCGRLENEKGYDIAVKAAAILKEKIDFIWYFVGEGSQRTELEALIKRFNLDDTVILSGFQQNPYPYINSADIYVQPSRFESYGITITEALMLERKVICIDCQNPYIEDKKTVLLCECDEQSLSSKILELYNDENLQNELINNVRKIKFSNNSKRNIENIIG